MDNVLEVGETTELLGFAEAILGVDGLFQAAVILVHGGRLLVEPLEGSAFHAVAHVLVRADDVLPLTSEVVLLAGAVELQRRVVLAAVMDVRAVTHVVVCVMAVEDSME